jgi:two-component system response regulator LytT
VSAMLRVLVVEDEAPARRYLVELLHDTGRARVVAAVGSADEADACVRDGALDLDAAFVDVHLAGDAADAGVRLVRGWRGLPEAPRVVLATAHAQHALAAFELGVTDYLLKPFTAARVAAAVERLTPRARAPERAVPERVVARQGKALVFLPTATVWAFEAEARLCFVHDASGRYDIDLSLSAVETSLAPRLVRVHRNWLVNLAEVRMFERDGAEAWLVLGDVCRSLRVPVARERVGAVREQLLASSLGVRGPGSSSA